MHSAGNSRFELSRSIYAWVATLVVDQPASLTARRTPSSLPAMTSPSMTAGEETTAPPVPLEKGQREGATLPPLRDMEVVAIGKVGEDHRGTRVLQCLCHLLRIFNTVLAGMQSILRRPARRGMRTIYLETYVFPGDTECDQARQGRAAKRRLPGGCPPPACATCWRHS